MERGPKQSRGRFMGTLSYRGHNCAHQPAAQKVCKQLSYRGIGYDKSLEADEECRLRNDRQSYFLLARRIVRAQFQFADESRTQQLWQEVADRGMNVDRITIFDVWMPVSK